MLLNDSFDLTDGYCWESRRLKNAEPVVRSRNMLFSQLEMIKYMHQYLYLFFILRVKLKGNTPLDGLKYSKFAAMSKVSSTDLHSLFDAKSHKKGKYQKSDFF